MGGTSTDVSHFDGEYERAFETEVAGVRMRAPMMLIHTVAAGGGSILHFDGARFRVGPDCAGANPGPEMLPPRRAARGHRRQRDGRQAHSRFLPEDFRARQQNQPLDADAVRASVRRRWRSRSAMAARPKRSPTASSRSRSRTWRTRSRRFRCSAAMTSRATRSTASAAPAASMPAWSPTRSA